MSFMRGDLFGRTRKLVKGLSQTEPLWLKAMERAPPASFPRPEGKIKTITLPEDVYIKKFYKKYPDSKYYDAIKISAFDHPPSRVYASRVLELTEQGFTEAQAMAVADIEYRAEVMEKKQADARLKKIACLQGKKPSQYPQNPYPSAVREIQAEERPYVRARFFDPKIREIVEQQKADYLELRRQMGLGGIVKDNQNNQRPGLGFRTSMPTNH